MLVWWFLSVCSFIKNLASSVFHNAVPEERRFFGFFLKKVYDLLKNQLPRLLLVPSPPWIVGVEGASPPPPRRGLAMRLPAPEKLKPPAPPRPRVLPALAASRRSLTEASWASNLDRGSLGQHQAFYHVSFTGSPLMYCRHRERKKRTGGSG